MLLKKVKYFYIINKNKGVSLMTFFKKKIDKEEYDKVVGELNTLKFENEDLKRSIDSLKKELDKVAPRINQLTAQLNEKQRYIDKYHIEVTKDPVKWAEHQKIDNPRGGKKK